MTALAEMLWQVSYLKGVRGRSQHGLPLRVQAPPLARESPALAGGGEPRVPRGNTPSPASHRLPAGSQSRVG